MPESRRETVETRGMTDRELMLDIYHRATEISGHLATLNGTVRDHNEEIYGSVEKKEPGMKEAVRAHDIDIRASKTVLKTLMAVVSIIGVGNVVALLTLAI